MKAFVYLPSDNQREKSFLLAVVSDLNPKESDEADPKGSRYAPPAAPTWLWSASSMAPSYPCTSTPPPLAQLGGTWQLP